MTLTIIISVLLIHFVSDFLYQTNKQTLNKGKSIKELLKHTTIYSILSGCLLQIMVQEDMFGAQETLLPIYFTLITFITHTVVDYFTSKLTSKLWNDEYKQINFVVFGFDQIIHLITLFTTINYLCY